MPIYLTRYLTLRGDFNYSRPLGNLDRSSVQPERPTLGRRHGHALLLARAQNRRGGGNRKAARAGSLRNWFIHLEELSYAARR